MERKMNAAYREQMGCFRSLLQKCCDWKIVPTADQGSPTILFSDIKKAIQRGTDGLIPSMYQYEALSVQKPTVWIPKGYLGISDDGILRVGEHENSIRVSYEHAAFDINYKEVFYNISKFANLKRTMKPLRWEKVQALLSRLASRY